MMAEGVRQVVVAFTRHLVRLYGGVSEESLKLRFVESVICQARPLTGVQPVLS
jgi:hypothetical protein